MSSLHLLCPSGGGSADWREDVRVVSDYPSGSLVVRDRVRLWSRDLPMMVLDPMWAQDVRSVTLLGVSDPIISPRIGRGFTGRVIRVFGLVRVIQVTWHLFSIGVGVRHLWDRADPFYGSAREKICTKSGSNDQRGDLYPGSGR
jgi:hypothetical protein